MTQTVRKSTQVLVLAMVLTLGLAFLSIQPASANDNASAYNVAHCDFLLAEATNAVPMGDLTFYGACVTGAIDSDTGPGGVGGGTPTVTDICSIAGATNSTFCKAQDTSNGNATNNPIVGQNGILTKTIALLTTISATIATVVIVIAGLMYSTAGGDASRAGKARSAIIYAAVALIVALVARLIIVVVLGRIG